MESNLTDQKLNRLAIHDAIRFCFSLYYMRIVNSIRHVCICSDTFRFHNQSRNNFFIASLAACVFVCITLHVHQIFIHWTYWTVWKLLVSKNFQVLFPISNQKQLNSSPETYTKPSRWHRLKSNTTIYSPFKDFHFLLQMSSLDATHPCSQIFMMCNF